MTKRSLASLIMINAVLLAALIVTVFTPQKAEAQGFAATGNRYLMISGEAVGRSSQAAVFIIELTSGQMVATMFNSANNKLEFVAARSVTEDAREGARQSR